MIGAVKKVITSVAVMASTGDAVQVGAAAKADCVWDEAHQVYKGDACEAAAKGFAGVVQQNAKDKLQSYLQRGAWGAAANKWNNDTDDFCVWDAGNKRYVGTACAKSAFTADADQKRRTSFDACKALGIQKWNECIDVGFGCMDGNHWDENANTCLQEAWEAWAWWPDNGWYCGEGRPRENCEYYPDASCEDNCFLIYGLDEKCWWCEYEYGEAEYAAELKQLEDEAEQEYAAYLKQLADTAACYLIGLTNGRCFHH